MVFLTSLQSIIPIVLLILLGYILKGRGMFNPTFSGNLSRFIMSVALPAEYLYLYCTTYILQIFGIYDMAC